MLYIPQDASDTFVLDLVFGENNPDNDFNTLEDGLVSALVDPNMINGNVEAADGQGWIIEGAENANSDINFINISKTDDETLLLDYSIHNSESWGGYVHMRHMHPEAFQYGSYDWSSYDSISFRYRNVFTPQAYGTDDPNAEGRAHLRFIVLEGQGEGLVDLEFYYSFHYVLDNEDSGWNTVKFPLKRNDSWDGNGFNLTEWAGSTSNGDFDLEYIAGFTVEFSVSGAGEGDYVAGQIILDDFELFAESSYEPPIIIGDFTYSLIDSSKNGYGAFRPYANPLAYSYDHFGEDNDGWVAAYRQFGSIDETTGFLGVAQSNPDGDEWYVETRINTTYPENQTYTLAIPGLPTPDGAPAARFPSALVSSYQNKATAVWNEYTLPEYGGGVPMYSYDFFPVGENSIFSAIQHINEGCIK